MRTGLIKVEALLAIFTLLANSSHAENSCAEGGPHYSSWECVSNGTLVPGYSLTPSNVIVNVGQVIPMPAASGLAITNGKQSSWVYFDCPSTPGYPGYTTNTPINYNFGAPFFAPTLPAVIWVPGTYAYTGKVVATGSPCALLTNTVGTLTVTVISNNPDVLFDVDFGSHAPSSKTGYAAIGDSGSDFWNGYVSQGQASGTLAGLKTAEGYVSPASLTVHNLASTGTNVSPDAMYNDYLFTNASSATLTFSNLPSGAWNIYLYSDDGNFTVSVLNSNNFAVATYGPQTCQDLPLSSPLAWQQGVQYVVFTNVTMTSAQTLSITAAPGGHGAAVISGLQLASLNHATTLVPANSAGMVGWWKGESNTLDSASTNNGTPTSVSYTNGVVGQAFHLSGGHISITDTPAFQLTNALTIEGWVRPRGNGYVVLWRGDNRSGLDPYTLSMQGNSNILFQICDANNNGVAVGAGVYIPYNQWSYVAGTYNWSGSSAQMKLYINGNLVSQTNTTVHPFGPLISNLNPMVCIGSINTGGFSFIGDLDEITLWSRALSQLEIQSIYAAGSAGKSPDISVVADTDYDGVSDLNELTDRTDPYDASSVLHLQLGYWPFDNTNTWVGSAGQLPLAATNVIGVPSWDTNAVLVDSSNPALLTYRDVETNGNANINLRCGTVRFWFRPDWSSTNAGGTGPGSMARLIEMGSYNSAFTNGWWSLYVSPDGSQLSFGSSTNGAGGVNLSANIAWVSNQWHQIVLTYTSSNSLLYLDGQLAASGAGSIYFPNLTERSRGFRIGSDQNGASQARGAFDDLQTFNYPLAPQAIIATPPETSSGTDFWTEFFDAYDQDGGLQLSLDISSPVAASGTVSIPGVDGGWSQTFTVTPGQVTTIDIPIDAMITDYDTVENHGIHITSTQPVSVYGINDLVFASEAFTAYPTPMLGTNYCVMARAAAFDDSLGLVSEFAIVATADDTEVTITPSATADLTDHPGTAPYTITLQQGQTYQINSVGGSDDVTGTLVGSDQPIAIMAGANLARVPNINYVAGNPLMEEQLPVSSWGVQALGFPLATRQNGDTYRVLAAQNNTVVKVNGAVVATLQAGQFYDATINGPVEFQASNPIQVAQFSNGSAFDGTTGDPFEMLLPPTGHYMTNYTVSMPDGFDSDYLNLYVEQSAISTTLVDGQPLPVSSFQPIGNSGYSGIQVPLAAGSHTVTGPLPVGVQVYGFASYDGYGYIGGVANFPLVAVPDSYNIPLNTPETLDVLANDVYSSWSDLVLGIASSPAHGAVTVTADKQIIYSPQNGYTGADQFSYQITENGIESSAIVTLWVNPPVAVDDYVTACSVVPVVIPVLANDYDPSGNPLTVISVSGGAEGTVVINPDNTVTYTPNAGVTSVTDSFAYTIANGQGGFASATVHVTMDSLAANDDNAQVFEGQSATIQVLNNDSSSLGGALTITAVTQGSGGSVAISPDQKSVIYTPSTGGLNNAREAHTATLLNNGEVLVAGGTDIADYLSSAELYNPNTGTWISTGSMHVPRAWATATLLPNGQVLVTGGVNASGGLSSAEVYDPNSGTWTMTTSMHVARLWHTATLLPNGQVLVAGGNNDLGNISRTAELYDPNSGSWSLTSNMQSAHEVHTATLLNNGQVLIAGGDYGGGYAPCELYDPNSGNWSLTGSLITRREDHTATLLNNGQVLVAGGGNASGELKSAELYDPNSGQWSSTGPMQVVREMHTATLLNNGEVLVAGGVDEYNESYASAELYDPNSGTWSYTGSMNEGHSYMTMTLLNNGQALVVGGQFYTVEPTAELYDPNLTTWALCPEFTGSDQFTYTVSDGTCTATANVNVSVVDPVQLQDDNPQVFENKATTINVLANDVDLSGGTLTITAVTQGANGSVTISSDHQTVVYTPNSGYLGSDTFTYTVSDGTWTATANVNVSVVNPVQPQDDNPQVFENKATTINVLANDVDLSSGTLTITAVTQGANGSVTISSDHQTVVYTPNSGYLGSDTFTYTVSDGTWTATANVNVSVVNPVQPQDDYPQVFENQATTIPVLANDSDQNNGTLTITAVTQGANGSVTISADHQTVVYTPNSGYLGSDTFTYTVSDGTWTATANVNVTVINPVQPQDFDQQVLGDTGTIIQVLDNVYDASDGTLTVTAVSQGANGSVSISADHTTVTYTPNTGYLGSDTFTYTVSDGTWTASATVNVTVVNPITANNASFQVYAGYATDLNVLSYDSDQSSGASLTITAVSSCSGGGTAVIDTSVTPPQIKYTPGTDTTADTFTYTTSDGTWSATATVTVSVSATPVMISDNNSVAFEGQAIYLPVLYNAYDLNNSVVTVSSFTQPANGQVVLNADGVSLTYTPNTGYLGPDSFSYTAMDADGYAATATVSLNVIQVPLPPVSFSPTGSGTLPVTVGMSVPGYPNAVIYYQINGGSWNTYSAPVVLSSDSTISAYASMTGFVNSSQSSQEFGNSLAPIAATDYIVISQDSGDNILNVLGNDKDSEGLGLTLSDVTAAMNGTAAIESDGALHYTPNAGFSGMDSFSYTIEGASGHKSEATVTVFVQNSTDQAPNTSDITVTLSPHQYTATINVLANDSDPDGNAISLYLVNPPQKGTATINNLGQISYTRTSSPNVLYDSDAFTYIVTDGLGGYAIGNVTVNQQDSDGNGMPDEWQLAKFGQLGTDPNGDPDNDGLPNITEYRLYTNPHVSDNPLSLPPGSLPSVLTGKITIPLGINANVDDNGALALYVDGQDVGAIAHKDYKGNWSVMLDTTTIENGAHQLSLVYNYYLDAQVAGATISVTVNNPISFPNSFSRIFGNQMWLYAETFPNASYAINMEDENQQSIGSFTGNADANGVISFTWDLTDGHGNKYASTNFYGVYTVTTTTPNFRPNTAPVRPDFSTSTPASQTLGTSAKSLRVHPNAGGGGSSSSATTTWAIEASWAPTRNPCYVIAYAPLDSSPVTDSREVNTMLGGGEGTYGGIIHEVSEYGLKARMLPSGNVDQSSAFSLDSPSARTTLLASLQDPTAHYFYFLGHGGTSGIGAYAGSGTYIDKQTLQDKIGNFLESAKPQNFHPYRFVFLDCCNAGGGSLSEAFGIPNKAVNNAFFASAGVSSRAFLGFAKPKNFPVTDSAYTWYAPMIAGFYNDWYTGLTIQECVNNAIAGAHTGGGGGHTMDTSATVLGAPDLLYKSP